MTSILGAAQYCFYDISTSEIKSVCGFEENVQEEVTRLIKLRDRTKKKRLRKKLNKKINKLFDDEWNRSKSEWY